MHSSDFRRIYISFNSTCKKMRKGVDTLMKDSLRVWLDTDEKRWDYIPVVRHEFKYVGSLVIPARFVLNFRSLLMITFINWTRVTKAKIFLKLAMVKRLYATKIRHKISSQPSSRSISNILKIIGFLDTKISGFPSE